MLSLKRSLLRKALLLFPAFAPFIVFSQVTGTFAVQGDINTYYPVSFFDGGFANNVATQLKLGRSSVHENATWRGSFIAEFNYHTTNWGNGAAFIKANIARVNNASAAIQDFVAGWKDVTAANNDSKIVIWLRGGGNTYHYQSNYAVSPMVYDGVQNALPFQETSGAAYPAKTAIDAYVNISGTSDPLSAYYTGSASNYFYSNVGLGITAPLTRLHINQGKAIITSTDYQYSQLQVLNPTDGEASMTFGANGTGPAASRTTYARQWQVGIGGYAVGMNNFTITNPTTLDKGFVFSYDGKMGIGSKTFPAGDPYRLYVEGGIRTRKIKVDQLTWADYVFDSSYHLSTLEQVEDYIHTNKHLPEVPAADKVIKEGVDLAENQVVLLKKIEELTLYMIEANKRMKAMEKEINELKGSKK